MNGRLILDGDLSILSAAAAKLAAEWPAGLTVTVEPHSWQGYTVETCRLIYAECNQNAKTVLRMAVEGNGFAPDSEVREALQHDSLRGMITGSITRGMTRLEKAGTIPLGLPKPLDTGTSSNTGSWGKTQGFRMEPELVALFKVALGL